MKKLFLSLLGFAAFTANAQDHIIETHNVKADVITKQGDRFNVSADKMSLDHTAGTIEYTGVESLTTDLIEICYADKVVYNLETNELILSGNLSVTGIPMYIDGSRKHNHIRYRIGDTVAYME